MAGTELDVSVSVVADLLQALHGYREASNPSDGVTYGVFLDRDWAEMAADRILKLLTTPYHFIDTEVAD